MAHYVCDGSCKGESDHQGVCEAESCERKGMALRECDCEDGKHGGEEVMGHFAGDDHPIDG